MVQTAQDVMSFAKEHGAQMVSLRFIDFIGRWRHFTVPLHELHEGTFEEGLAPWNTSSTSTAEP
ncbi:glutamine synthetase [Cystobacter ferrugineus]|uniref:GS beta-grasp domain-containing protein n=1 Tax=Cystobacter ferrugineus TaxID=83449 RepID=A0A1L9BIZ6_9BACT|nr:glutamine synthetase [Cystobacter ferrugineus]OJH42241.1 hypothetical protein BON30_03250 [Cystobacter ferrugineus]